MPNQKKKTIMFSGGGSGGPVAPLLAVAEELWRDRETEDQDLRLIFVGTAQGPERQMVSAFNQEVGPMEFIALPSGKWRRYFSLANFLDIFRIIIAFFKSFPLLKKNNPQIVVSAGAFVSVPLVWAAAIKKIPILIHQQDLRPGLANRLMAPFARAITTVFDKSLIDYGPRAVLAGNPIRQAAGVNDDGLIAKLKAEYSLDNSIPLILAFGGGLGAAGINNLIFAAAADLVRDYQVIHLTGKGKMPAERELTKMPGYHVAEFLDNRTLSALISMADLVVCRAGLGTLTELSYWRKPALLIPMPRSHQQDNAAYFSQAKAAVSADQDSLDAKKFIGLITGILSDSSRQRELSNNIGRIIKRDAAATVSAIIQEIVSAEAEKK